MSKIKICGLFRQNDIDYVNEAKPDYIGFVFAKSRRQVTPETAWKLRNRLDSSIVPVGVFVNAAVENIEQAYNEGIIRLAQLHGQEDEEYIQRLRQRCAVPVIKAMRVDTAGDILKWQTSSADFLLLDNGTGGTGKAFNWALIPDIKKAYFLAGGINPENIENALRLSPFCIDVSSGAETDGVKDKEKIRYLVQRVREVL